MGRSKNTSSEVIWKGPKMRQYLPRRCVIKAVCCRGTFLTTHDLGKGKMPEPAMKGNETIPFQG